MNLGAYQPFKAQMDLGEPKWPAPVVRGDLEDRAEGPGDRLDGSPGGEAASRNRVMPADPLGRFAEIWAVDFEFITGPGERPDPVCMVARELRSGRVVRVWRESLREMQAPPFPIGENTLYVAYSASAELSCHLALGWPLPVYVLDAYVEFLGLINGLPQRFAKGGTSQLGALAYFGLTSITADEKTHWRKRILAGPPFSAEEAVGILDYCKTDVDGLAACCRSLCRRLSPRPHWVDHALLRGRYVKAVARMEHTGVPIDVPALWTARRELDPPSSPP